MSRLFDIYPPKDGLTAEELRRGVQWLYTDVTCVHCGKCQPVAATGHVGGPCVRCGQPTTGAKS